MLQTGFTNDITEVLELGMQRILDPHHWTSGEASREAILLPSGITYHEMFVDDECAPTLPTNKGKSITQYCAVGALDDVLNSDQCSYLAFDRANLALDKAARYLGYDATEYLNDRAGWELVITMYTIAIIRTKLGEWRVLVGDSTR